MNTCADLFEDSWLVVLILASLFIMLFAYGFVHDFLARRRLKKYIEKIVRGAR